jgi:hypothetical protein
LEAGLGAIVFGGRDLAAIRRQAKLGARHLDRGGLSALFLIFGDAEKRLGDGDSGLGGFERCLGAEGDEVVVRHLRGGALALDADLGAGGRGCGETR